MHDARAVGRVEGRTNLLHDLHHLSGRQPRRAREAPRERLAVEQLHHQEGRRRGVGPLGGVEAEVFHPHDVAVPQPGGDLRLAEKTLDGPRVARDVGQQHLHGHGVPEQVVRPAEDYAHRAGVDRLDQAPAPGQDVTWLRHTMLATLYRPPGCGANAARVVPSPVVPRGRIG